MFTVFVSGELAKRMHYLGLRQRAHLVPRRPVVVPRRGYRIRQGKVRIG
jgi:hypothetical protein